MEPTVACFACGILRRLFPKVRFRVILGMWFDWPDRITANVTWPLIVGMRMIGKEFVRNPELLLPLPRCVPVIKVHPLLLSFI
jgi:hypothetical protein